jgi:hypothetical protein
MVHDYTCNYVFRELLRILFYPFPALGEDFQIIESYVVIPENFTRGIIDFSVDIVADSFVEGDHSFFVRIVNDGSFTVGTNSELEVVILDDDSEFKVQPPK